LFEEGVVAAKAEDWSKARGAFLQAWRLKQHWQIAANLGRAELMLKRYCDAVDHLTYFLKEAENLSASDRKQAQEMLDEALAKVGSLKVQIDVDGAEVLVDGQPVGKSPLTQPVCVEAGNRTIEARHEAYTPMSKSVNVSVGKSQEARLRLTSRSRAPAESKICSEPTLPGRSSEPNTILLMSGIGLTLAGATIGVVATMNANERGDFYHNNNVEGYCIRSGKAPGVCEDELRDAHSDFEQFSNIALGSFVGAGISALLTAGYGVVSYHTSQSRTANVYGLFSVGKNAWVVTVGAGW
jgi:hypothetical protein